MVEDTNKSTENVPKSFWRNSRKGPHGLGDPNDTCLRKVEREVLIPQKMRDKAKEEKCIREVAEFGKCCKATNMLMVVRCRKENNALKACLTRWFEDPQFKEECTKEYLHERSEYRKTGVPVRKFIRGGGTSSPQ